MSHIEFDTILCPTDFSDPSKKALEYALATGKSFGAKIIFVHVVEPVINSAVMGHAITVAAQLEEELEEESKKHLDKLAAEHGYDNFETKVLRGKSAQKIIDYAGEINADLIVIGTHGRSGISHLLIGSTAEKVVRNAPCPVLSVKSDTPSAKVADDEL